MGLLLRQHRVRAAAGGGADLGRAGRRTRWPPSTAAAQAARAAEPRTRASTSPRRRRAALGDFPHELAAARAGACKRAEQSGARLLRRARALARGPQLLQPGTAGRGRAGARRGAAASSRRPATRRRRQRAEQPRHRALDDRADITRPKRSTSSRWRPARRLAIGAACRPRSTTWGSCSRSQRALAEARRLHERSLALRREIGDRNWTAMSLSNIGVVLFEQDRLNEAAKYYRSRWRSPARSATSATSSAPCTTWRSSSARSATSPRRGPATKNRCPSGRRSATPRRLAARVELGMVLLAQGDLEGARKCQEEAVTQAREVSLVEGEAQAVFQLGEVALAAGDARGRRAAITKPPWRSGRSCDRRAPSPRAGSRWRWSRSRTAATTTPSVWQRQSAHSTSRPRFACRPAS